MFIDKILVAESSEQKMLVFRLLVILVTIVLSVWQLRVFVDQAEKAQSKKVQKVTNNKRVKMIVKKIEKRGKRKIKEGKNGRKKEKEKRGREKLGGRKFERES